MERKKLKLDFEMTIFDVVDLNKSFAAAKCLVCYTGRNRNYSDIGKNQIMDALPSIRNIPVVGRYDVEKDDFGSHDIKVVDTKDGIDIVNVTIPFGLVPESANQWFETRLVNGVEKECFFTDVILWKRQHGYERIAEADKISESMEIDVSEYIVDSDGYCIVDKFEFDALCLLGDTVEPCFENACVQMYSNEIVSDFKLQFSEMLREFKEMNHTSIENEENDINNIQEGGLPLADEKDIVENTDEVTEETVEPTVDEAVDAEVTDTPAETEVEVIVESNTDVTEEVTVEETETVAESENEDETVEEFAETEKVEKSEYDALASEFEAYKLSHSHENSEFESLATFKQEVIDNQRKLDIENTFAKFDKKLSGYAEYEALKTSEITMDVSDLEEKLFAMIGKKTANFSVRPKESVVTVPVETFESTDDDGYGGILAKKYNK